MKYVVFIVLLLMTATLVLLSGFTLPTAVALLVLASAVASDFYTTWRCLRVGGKEGNPVVAFLFKRVGVPKAFALMVAVWTVFVLLRWLPQSEGIQTAVAIAYWLVPLNNLTVLAKLRRKNATP